MVQFYTKIDIYRPVILIENQLKKFTWNFSLIRSQLAKMIVYVEFKKDGETVKKKIICDEDVDCVHLKELACCEAFTSPAFTKIFFNGKLLLGGVVDGSTITLESMGL